MPGFPIMLDVRLRCTCGNHTFPQLGAPSITCSECSKITTISRETWRTFAEEATLDGPDLPAGERRERQIEGVEVTFGRIEVECQRCDAAIPDATIAAALGPGTCACPRCGTAATIRPVPADLVSVFPGASHLIDAANMYVWHQPSLRKNVARTTRFTWTTVEALATDRDGNVYLLADGTTAACLDRDGKTRWVHAGLPIGKDPALAVTTDAVLVWAPARASAIRLSRTDGADLGTVGGHQPDHADRHHLDLRGCESLAADTDGTLLLVKGHRLVRCAADGTGVATWPTRKGFLGRTIKETLRPFVDADFVKNDDVPSAEELGSHPTRVRGADVAVGWDGHVYVTDHRTVACFDRSGKRTYRAAVERAFDTTTGSDATGHAYRFWMDYQVPEISRVTPTGEVALFVDGHKPETPLDRVQHLAVAPDGTMFLAGDNAILRILAPDGTPRYRSARTIEEDDKQSRKATADRAARIARGEDP